MATRNKRKVYLHKMGGFPTIGNFQKVNRKTTVYYAEKLFNKGESNEGMSSIFFLIRPKDVEKLKSIGYNILSIDVPKDHYPFAIDYGNGNGTELGYKA